MLLTHESAALTVGNFLGDMIRNSELREVPADVQKGVFVHRWIDSYTDNHEVVRDVVRLLRESQGKYAPVAADVLFDHVLAIHWDDYCHLDYTAFCQKIYHQLLSRIHAIPERLQDRARRMIQFRWIEGYENEDQFYGTLERLDTRSRFPSNFTDLLIQYEENRDTINGSFMTFFPELQQEASAIINPQSAGKS